MSCDRWIDLLVDRSANELDEEETILLEQHLADCPECRSEESAPESDPCSGGTRKRAYRPAPDMERRIWARWQLEHGSDAGSGTRRPFRLMLPFTRQVPVYVAATVAILAVLAGLWMGQRGIHPSQEARASPPLPSRALHPARGFARARRVCHDSWRRDIPTPFNAWGHALASTCAKSDGRSDGSLPRARRREGVPYPAAGTQT